MCDSLILFWLYVLSLVVDGQEDNKKDYVALNLVTSDQSVSQEMELKTPEKEETKVKHINIAAVIYTDFCASIFSMVPFYTT